jgi:hypothetical protein
MADTAGIPKGIEPIFFTPAGKEVFDLKIDENISEQEPHRILQKKEMIEDIDKRGVLSEFFHAKDKIKVNF